jgi:hypothetical protein
MPTSLGLIKKYKKEIINIGFLILIISLIIHLLIVSQLQFTQDDAFITFRYAGNYLNEEGLVFNTGERVEGYTNFLWTIFMIIGGMYGCDYVAFSQILGVFFGLATIIMTYLIARVILSSEILIWRSVLAGLACLILASTYSFAYWTISGLESSAFAFSISLIVFSYLRRSFMLLPALMLTTLLRPEGILVFIIIISYELLQRSRRWHFVLFIVFGYILFLLPYAFFKLLYYDSILPNTFYAKTSFTYQQLLDGLKYAGLYVWHYWGGGIFLLPVMITLWRTGRDIGFPAVTILIYSAYIILIGGDVLGVHRFFVPLMPLLIILAVYGVNKISKYRIIVIVILLCLISWQIFIPRLYVFTFLGNEKILVSKSQALMKQLKQVDKSNFSLATSTIGAISYELMGHRVVDLLGLTDTTIARHPEPQIEGLETTWRERHYNSRYILSNQIDYIRFSTGYKPSAPAERALFMYSEFLNNYRTLPFRLMGTSMPVYKRYYPLDKTFERDVDIKFVQYLNNCMNYYSSRRNYQAAAAYLDSAWMYSPDPTYPYLYLYKSFLYEAQGDMENAKKSLETLINKDTTVAEAYFKLGYYATLEKNNDLIRECQMRVIQLVPWYFKNQGNAAPTEVP